MVLYGDEARQRAPRAAPGWDARSRAEAMASVRSVMAGTLGPLAALEAVAEEICSQLSATSLSLIALEDGTFWDAIDVGVLPPEHNVFARQTPYSASHYPVATSRLLYSGGYRGANDNDQVLVEYRALWPQVSVGSIMGVSMTSQGKVSGELFLLRDESWTPFTGEDFSVARDLATVVAGRLSLLLAGHDLQFEAAALA